MTNFKNPTCRGSYALGTACGSCERCDQEKVPVLKQEKPDGVKVVKFPKGDPETLKNFLEEIEKGGTRPMFYIGLHPEDGHAVLHTMPMSWKDLAYIKTAFDMHVTRDWLGLLDKQE